RLLYTENESNRGVLGWGENAPGQFFKDGINRYIIHQDNTAVNPNAEGTKVAPYYVFTLGTNETKVIQLRLSNNGGLTNPLGPDFDTIFQTRKAEAEAFYQAINPFPISDDMRNVQKQAFAGMLWSKQFYYYVVQDWLNGDPVGPPPPEQRKQGRNKNWTHVFNEDILSMPDKWEYPWFAAWDLAFHTVTFALIDPSFAKHQLRLLTREWYLHPNGQMPAYEWAFGDVNPPVHAWAALRVYRIEKKMFGTSDRDFLEEIFQKLSLYFTWWTNRKDPQGDDIFGGGFLGLDNIGPIDRSHLGSGESIEQSDGTAWMAMYCLNMLEIALELAKTESIYDRIASKFFQHFLLIADAMNKVGSSGVDLWDPDQKFYRDILNVNGQSIPINVRSMVGLIPLFAVTSISGESFEQYQSYDFKKRFDWFIKNRPDLTEHENVAVFPDEQTSGKAAAFLALVSPSAPEGTQSRLKCILERMLDSNEFLSPYGIRALSKAHEDPYIVWVDGKNYGQVNYEPAESTTDLFGGNSNWRGPIWFPVNFLIIESLQKFNFFLGDDFTVEYPVGSQEQKTLWDVSADLSYRLIKIFLKDDNGRRPIYGGDTTLFGANNRLQTDPNWNDYILFFEYYHGDNGAGIGASHQTGWTGVVAKLIQQYGEYQAQSKSPETL
ncbi:MAG: glucosidase, partial [Symploca sp. SIO2B6]|nr:glucosidase [Symploca sp. SIO2B6]